MGDSIREVRRAQLSGEAGTFGPLRVYIVNFAATSDFPRKFFYKGCTRVLGSGRLCSKTVEGVFRCQHNSVEKGTWTEMFRFNVFLVDGSVNPDCPPLRAAIFDAASSLLGTPIEEFCVLDPPEQLAIMSGMSTEMRLADVFVRLNLDRQLVVQTLSLVKPKRIETTKGGQDSSRKSTSSSQSTPSAYLTPRPGGESSAGSSSTSGPSNADLDSVKSLLHKVIEKLDRTQL